MARGVVEKTILAWSEKTFQEQVIGAAQALGWPAVYHVHDSRRSAPGFPDLVRVHPKHGLIFRELKTERGRLTPDQHDWIDLLQHTGHDAQVWRPRDWASRLIHDELSGRRRA